MDMAYTIRRAVKSDAAAACEVVRRSIIELCAADHRGDRETLAKWLKNKTAAHFEDWIASDRSVALVAERAEAIVGVGLMNLSGAIHLLYVSPDARFSGVSKALLAALEEEAAAAGISDIRLESTVTAQRFYANAGYSRDCDATSVHAGMCCLPMYRRIDNTAGSKIPRPIEMSDETEIDRE